MISTPSLSVLVPLDGSEFSELALPVAIDIAGQFGTVHLVSVVPHRSAAFAGHIHRLQDATDELREIDTEAANAYFPGIITRFSPQVKLIDWATLEGDPAEQILAFAAANPIDMVVMSTHGRGAVGRNWFGSVADRVVREGTTTVMLVRPIDGGQSIPTRVVFSTDGSDLASTAMPTVVLLAQSMGVPVHLLRVIDPAGALASYTAGAMLISRELYEETENAFVQEAHDSLAALRAELIETGLTVSTELRQGNTTNEILRALEPTDVVVMTSRGRSGIARWAIGSVAERLVRHAPGPVVIVPGIPRDHEKAATSQAKQPHLVSAS